MRVAGGELFIYKSDFHLMLVQDDFSWMKPSVLIFFYNTFLQSVVPSQDKTKGSGNRKLLNEQLRLNFDLFRILLKSARGHRLITKKITLNLNRFWLRIQYKFLSHSIDFLDFSEVCRSVSLQAMTSKCFVQLRIFAVLRT